MPEPSQPVHSNRPTGTTDSTGPDSTAATAAGGDAAGAAPGRPGPDYDWSWSGREIETDWVPPSVDVSRPNVARIYDYYLGGKDNFAADRQAAEQIKKLVPDVHELAIANRAFLSRAVHCMVTELGIRQFIDLGTGIPTSPNIHELGTALDPGVKVAYVDHDSVVLAHNRAILADTPAVVAVQHDLCDSGAVLADPEVRQLIDFTQPVGLLFIAVLHFVTHDIAPDIIARYTQELVPGSALAISVASSDGADPAVIRQAEAIYSRSESRAVFRTRAQVEQLFEGLDLVEPGLDDITVWRHPEGQLLSTRGLAGVAVKR